MTDEGLKALALYLINLQSLNLSRCRKITDVGLKALAPYLTKLQHLVVYGCRNITDETLQEFISRSLVLRLFDKLN